MKITSLFTLTLMLAGVARAIPTIVVLPSVAPNAFGSPSYPGYVSNAIYALGLSSYGTPGTPQYYQQVSEIWRNELVVTGFPPWLAVANRERCSLFWPPAAALSM